MNRREDIPELGSITVARFQPDIQGKISYLDQNIRYSADPRIVIYTYVYQPAEYVINVFQRIVFRIDLNFNENSAWARVTQTPHGGEESSIVVMSGDDCVSTVHGFLQIVYDQTLNSDHSTGRVSAARRLIIAQSRKKTQRFVTTRMITDLEQICNRISMMQSTES